MSAWKQASKIAAKGGKGATDIVNKAFTAKVAERNANTLKSKS